MNPISPGTCLISDLLQLVNNKSTSDETNTEHKIHSEQDPLYNYLLEK